MLLIENIRLALTSIRTNKMRSFLTMLGIIIGISSVIAITSIGASAKGAVSKQFESYGQGYMYLELNWQMTGDYLESEDLMNMDDVDALKSRFPEDLLYVAPFASDSCQTMVGRKTADLSFLGVAADYNKFVSNIKIIHGRMINKTDVDGSRNNVVIPVEAAQYLFGTEDAVGKTLPVEILGTPADMTVVGVYEIPASIFSSLSGSTKYQCYAAYTTLSGGYLESYYLEIFANPEKSISDQGNAFANYMTKIKGKPAGYYMYESAEAQMGAINSVLGILSIAIGAIAAISLLVGGIGIMNIMLVSVTERTREIGVRKSLGARTKDILTQFLIEAMILSVIGGIIGTLLGLGIAGIGMLILGVDLVVQVSAVVLAVLFSAAVGLFFGLFPARKAARLDPIEALRYE